jgi:CheY-like chemotaxis protein
VAACLIKPVKQSELFNAIAEALGICAPEDDQETVDVSSPKVPPLRVLLAEDNRVNQKLAMGLLEKWGHHVQLAETGLQAIDAWKEGSFDLIIMDIQMPQMDGLQAARQIRAIERERGGHVPMIAMTAHAMAGDREECLQAGMDGYVAKPLRMREFQNAIASFFLDPSANSAIGAEQSPVPEAALDDAPLPGLDWQFALAACAGDQQLLFDVMGAFVEEIPKLLVQTSAAQSCRDAASLQRVAHMIKGALRPFGPTASGDCARQIEELAASGQLDAISPLIENLEALLEPVLVEVARVIETHPPLEAQSSAFTQRKNPS